MNLSLAVPKGRLLGQTAAILSGAGLALDNYNENSRLYRLKSGKYPDMRAKIFQEKDIPIQVAIGNYDMGICGSEWIEEQMVKYPSSALVSFKNLGYGAGAIYAAVSDGALHNNTIDVRGPSVRIVSEYPNLAEALAQKLRLKRYRVFPLWGGAEGYPPENAEISILFSNNEADLNSKGLVSIGKIVDSTAVLIVNRTSLENKDLSPLLEAITFRTSAVVPAGFMADFNNIAPLTASYIAEGDIDISTVKLALPDGHQQAHVRKILDAAGINMSDYPATDGNRRPFTAMEGFQVKTIRPQDMPLQVANGNFDIAITGRDWLTDHLYQFPGSPVTDMLDLKYGWVRIVSVVSNDVPVHNSTELQSYCQSGGRSYRIASEYINIADSYARNNHLGKYRVIPTWGATEAFIPEDADVLIENTETGSTLAKNNLRIIDTLFESTACVIGRKDGGSNSIKQRRIMEFLGAMENGVKALA
jgi:ATP phosphoribosyltransferase